MENIEAYPLAWPVGIPRTPENERKRSNFGREKSHSFGRSRLSIGDGRDRVLQEIRRYGRVDMDTVVISSDVRTRQDGLPYANARLPDDPGVCVYFELDGMPIALPCDTFDRMPDNLAAIAGHIEADRRQERYGVGTSAQRYAGFAALPAPGQASGTPWWSVLGLESSNVTPDDIRKAYKKRAFEVHPDRNPEDEHAEDKFHAVQNALSQGLAATEERP